VNDTDPRVNFGCLDLIVPELHRARPRPASLSRVATLSDFLDVTVGEARTQWRSMLDRRPAGPWAHHPFYHRPGTR
jgi:hypothetical protein